MTKKCRGGFKAGSSHPRFKSDEERYRELLRLDLGTLRLEKRFEVGARSRRFVYAKCNSCQQVKRYNVDNLLRRRTTNCSCRRGVKYCDPRELVIARRFDAIKQRCENPRCASYANYGDIGIQCRFSRAEFVSYIIENLPHEDYIGLDIDRINNNGHYEVGNLQLSTRAENLRNRSNSRFCSYRGLSVPCVDLYDHIVRDYPQYNFSREWTSKLAYEGIPVSDILRRGGGSAGRFRKRPVLD